MTHSIRVVCAWCPDRPEIGRKPCPPEQDGEESHGICDACYARYRRELDSLVGNRGGAPATSPDQADGAPAQSAAPVNSPGSSTEPREAGEVGAGDKRHAPPPTEAPAGGAAPATSGTIRTPSRVYVPLAYIAQACGVSEHELHHRHRPLSWGVPGHWRLRGGVTLYAEDALPELINALFDAGLGMEATRLRAWLHQFTAGSGGTAESPPFAGRTTDAPARRFWWEDRE